MSRSAMFNLQMGNLRPVPWKVTAAGFGDYSLASIREWQRVFEAHQRRLVVEILMLVGLDNRNTQAFLVFYVRFGNIARMLGFIDIGFDMG